MLYLNSLTFRRADAFIRSNYRSFIRSPALFRCLARSLIVITYDRSYCLERRGSR